jgi:hypothetical protein
MIRGLNSEERYRLLLLGEIEVITGLTFFLEDTHAREKAMDFAAHAKAQNRLKPHKA